MRDETDLREFVNNPPPLDRGEWRFLLAVSVLALFCLMGLWKLIALL